MNKMTSYFCCIQALFCIVVRQIASSPAGHWTHQWICPPDNNFQYNLCHDPTHPNTIFSTESRKCNIPSDLKNNLRRVTLETSDHLQDKINDFETQFIGWQYRIEQLQLENLTNILGMVILNGLESENLITTEYLKMAKFLRLFHKLWCLYSFKAEHECSLSFTDTFHRLKHRLLGKWWIVQNSCGQYIHHHHCETSAPLLSNNNLGCEDIRSVIYVLLRDARSLINDSLATIDQI